MDILEILETNGKNLISEDLDYFITELETGEYKQNYKNACLKKIGELKKWKDAPSDTEVKPDDDKSDISGVPGGMILERKDVEFGADKSKSQKPDNVILKEKLESFRKQSTYKSLFKNYITTEEYITEDFIDKNFGVLEDYETDLLVSVKEFSEDFLEKYFDVFNPDKIARYQKFSESFFMKHFSQLDWDLVLNKGKNEWRKKENRSKQLDVFLRLKGVRS